MTRLLTTAIFAALLLPQLAHARGPVFEAPELAPRAVRHLDDPVLVDRDDAHRHLDAMAADINALRDVARNLRSRRARRALHRRIKNLEANLRRARTQLQRAPELERTRRRPAKVVYRPAPQPEPYAEPVRRPEPRQRAASGKQMNELMLSMEAATFRDDKLRVIRSAVDHHWFTTEQARQMVEQLAFGDDRVTAISTVYPKLVDPENSHSLYSLLAHASDRRDLEKRLATM